jgi:uridine kinase
MRGDVVIVEEPHRRAAAAIVAGITDRIRAKATRYVITVAGESGSGKSETAQAIADELAKRDIGSTILGQDDYFVLPPRENDAKRRADPDWLGPHVEVRLDVM